MNRADSRLIVIVALLTVTFGLVVFVAILPLLNRVNSLKSELKKVASERSALESRATTLAELAETKDEIEALGERALTYLPTSVAASYFVMDVEKMSAANTLIIPTISFQPPDKKTGTGSSGVAEYRITLTADGQFSQLQSFLANLEDNLRFARFTSATMGIGENSISLQLAGSLYSKPENKTNADQSLVIEQAMKDLLNSRRAFGDPIPANQPSRPDPFAKLP